MNALELADAMDTYGFRYHHVKKAVIMLRQQQAEIEALKEEVAMWKESYENNLRFEGGYGHN
jgi:hypothetical protein